MALRGVFSRIIVCLDAVNEPQRPDTETEGHRGLCGGWRRLPRLGGPLSAAARRGEADLEARRAAEPQSAHLKRDRRRHPDRWHRRGTPSTPSASRRSSATPQTSLRLCASAREKQRRDDQHPLEEPIARHPPPASLRVAADASNPHRVLCVQTSVSFVPLWFVRPTTAPRISDHARKA